MLLECSLGFCLTQYTTQFSNLGSSIVCFLLQDADCALLRNLDYQIQSQFLQDDINSTREQHKKVSSANPLIIEIKLKREINSCAKILKGKLSNSIRCHHCHVQKGFLINLQTKHLPVTLSLRVYVLCCHDCF